jgi:hypothetical protein
MRDPLLIGDVEINVECGYGNLHTRIVVDKPHRSRGGP